MTNRTSVMLEEPRALGDLDCLADAADLELPTLPVTAMRAMRLLADENTTRERLLRVIQADQNIAARILRIANSAAYRAASEVKTLPEATTRIGLRAIGEVLLALDVRASLFDHSQLKGLMDWHWRTALAAGLWCREIAILSGRDPEMAYLCGLLHNVAAPVALKCLAAHTRFEGQSELALIQTKATLIGPVIAQRLCTEWELPEEVRQTITGMNGVSRNQSDLIVLVRLARRLSNVTFEPQIAWPSAYVEAACKTLQIGQPLTLMERTESIGQQLRSLLAA